jgi:phage shock protein E
MSLLFVVLVHGALAQAKAVWIDVRTPDEHALDSIEGDMRISQDDIVAEVTKLYPDKNTEIHLYCGSGRRAGRAAEALEQAGYTNVSNAGGIDDARSARGLAQ